ncbi:ABC transporter substrate-binding protein [Clostridium tagluense]|uniref:ABC transporter substrate-binding protein n=1 Tax=Clostridium tagluense TaxID=360422 RepID=UPI001CF50D33|nr:ABC transporter substrate-binding protein [Clostridium tagluense]MCB2297504.1 ABC transporter substrate-binding protein [Clostridium tagluense]
MKIVKKSFVLFLSLIVLLTGCSKQAIVKKEDTKINKNIRVITTYKPATDIVLALGGKDKLVGVNDGFKKDPLIMKLDETLIGKLAEVGSKKNGINIEQIVALKPDVVILYPTKESDDTMKKLTQQNIKVISINPESIALLQSDIIKIGDAIGESENSKKLVAYYKEKIEDVTKKLTTIKDKKTVYLAGAHGVLSTCSGDFYQHEMIEAAGGIDVAAKLKGGWNDVSVEQVIAWNPEVITSVMYCKDGSPAKIMEKAELQTVRAIKDKKIYQIPSNITPWDMPQPSSILAILWMSKTLYPEQFKDLDIHAVANKFYSDFYGKSFDELGGTMLGKSSTKK